MPFHIKTITSECGCGPFKEGRQIKIYSAGDRAIELPYKIIKKPFSAERFNQEELRQLFKIFF